MIFCILATAQKNAPFTKSVKGVGDPDENRTRVTAVKGRCLNRLTTGPNKIYMKETEWTVLLLRPPELFIFHGSGSGIRTYDTPGMNRMLYQLSYAAINVPYLTGTMYYKGYSEICQLHLCAFS